MDDNLNAYRKPARILHWGIAIAVLLMIPAGLIMVTKGLPRPVQDMLFLFHKNTGVLLFPFILFRLFYRMAHPAPPLPATLPHWQQAIARLTHAGLYLLLLVMPISGYIRVRAGGYPIEMLDALSIGPGLAKNEALAQAAQGLHYLCAMILIVLVMLHIGAALYHALVLRDGVWSRMWP